MITVVLAEDHPIVREGCRALLEETPGVSVVAETGDGIEAVRLVEDLKPDVLIVDLSMPGLDGLEVTRQATTRVEETRIVVLSMHDHESYVMKALDNGAAAYVLKEATAHDLVQAVRAAHRGEHFFSASIPTDIVERYERSKDQAPKDRYAMLTAREREVLQLIAEGYTGPEIAEKLFISPRTVDTHRSNLMAKLDLHSQAEVVRYAIQRGLIPLDQPPNNRGS